MDLAFARHLRCPRCRTDAALAVSDAERDDREIRAGLLICRHCRLERPIADGIADLLHDPPARVIREAAGLARFADLMRADGWDRERVLRLPDEPQPFWVGQKNSFNALLEQVGFAPGQRVLDVGANTCWASAAFARRGLEAVAMDISPHELQGLRTADWWMERDGTHFERVLGMMFDLPFAAETFDHVFCCEVLHHNSWNTLLPTFREIARVLKPGGTLSVIRETLRAPLTPQLRPGHEVAEFEGNEHAFTAASYYAAARRAGLRITPLEPPGHWVLGDEPFAITPATTKRAKLKLGALDALRQRDWGRRVSRAYLYHVAGTTPLHFLGTKPAD